MAVTFGSYEPLCTKKNLGWTKEDEKFVSSNRYQTWFNDKGTFYQKNLIFNIANKGSLSGIASIIEQGDYPEGLTLSATQNVTNPNIWKPFTPWIACHRWWHAIDACLGRDQGITDTYHHLKSLEVEATFTVFNMLHQAIKHSDFCGPNFTKIYSGWKKPYPYMPLGSAMVGTGYLCRYVHHFMTFKAAREQKISNPADIMPDLFAQWMLKGTVVFKQGSGMEKHTDTINALLSDVYEAGKGLHITW